MPRKPASTIQNTAPGPPMPTATATPAMLPRPDRGGERGRERLEGGDLADLVAAACSGRAPRRSPWRKPRRFTKRKRSVKKSAASESQITTIGSFTSPGWPLSQKARSKKITLEIGATTKRWKQAVENGRGSFWIMGPLMPSAGCSRRIGGLRMSRQAARTLSEHASKGLLADFGVPLAREALARTPGEAAAAAEQIGFPVVREALRRRDRAQDRARARAARARRRGAPCARRRRELLAAARPEDGPVVAAGGRAGARQARADRRPGARSAVRSLRAARTRRHPDRGAAATWPSRAAPLSHAEARALVGRLRASAPRDAAPSAASRRSTVDALADVLVALGRVGAERPDVASVDLNPLIVRATASPSRWMRSSSSASRQPARRARSAPRARATPRCSRASRRSSIRAA